MTEPARDVLITGIGLVSSLGEGIAAHLELLGASDPVQPVIETERFAPYLVHPLPPIDWSRQIPKKGDQRQMETWQKLGTYAAGLALSDAGITEGEEPRSHIDMIVAAGGGERDLTVDALVMQRAREAGSSLNGTLASELRPTLFLAQLSNLLAGNISIVHKVTGSSRTFMGEEGAGVSAVATAFARIAAGQSDVCLVGGAFSAERKDLLLNYELAGLLARDEWRPVFARARDHDGLCIGSVGAFLVLESRDHASARSATAYAKLTDAAGDRGPRDGASLADRLDSLFARAGSDGDDLLVMSGASGLLEPTRLERQRLQAHFPQASLRGYGSVLGHSFEAHFAAGVALAAGALSRAMPMPSFGDDAGRGAIPAKRALVTSVGHVASEGVCVLQAVSKAGKDLS